MTRLKRWESPRKSGRNDKGRGGSARQRQLHKRNQVLRQRLKDSKKQDPGSREVTDLSFFIEDTFIEDTFIEDTFIEDTKSCVCPY